MFFCFQRSAAPSDLHSFPTRRSSDLQVLMAFMSRATHVLQWRVQTAANQQWGANRKKLVSVRIGVCNSTRSEEHTSELQSPCNLVCRLLLEKKKKRISIGRLIDKYNT